MKLNKKQREKLYNCHIGVGFIAFNSKENELTEFEFYINKNNEIKLLNNQINQPEINLNKKILESCDFSE